VDEHFTGYFLLASKWRRTRKLYVVAFAPVKKKDSLI